MYARALTIQEAIPPAEPLGSNPVPYCFILDDAYRVVMAGPSGGEDPLASLYGADSRIDELPGPIDRVVRALTATWRTSRLRQPRRGVAEHLKIARVLERARIPLVTRPSGLVPIHHPLRSHE